MNRFNELFDFFCREFEVSNGLISANQQNEEGSATDVRVFA